MLRRQAQGAVLLCLDCASYAKKILSIMGIV